MANTARARRTWPSGNSASHPSTPIKPAGWVSEATENPPPLRSGGGFSVASLTQPAGFIGVDGWLALLPDGQVRRALAVFAIERGGPQMVEPAPQSANVGGA